MAFDVSAEAYGRFMGRFSEPLAAQFVELTGVRTGHRALDVGCGPGALTSLLAQRLGPTQVSAIDPSPPFVTAVRARCPGVDVRSGGAEDLPFSDNGFDLALAQLVVHFMADPVQGLSEMARVTVPGGLVAASVWDHGGGNGPLSTFWRAAHDTDPTAPDESQLAGAREGHLGQLFMAAGLTQLDQTVLTVRLTFEEFDDWWEPFTLGVGPAGDYVAHLDHDRRDVLRARCSSLLTPAPFEVTASAWCVVARA